MDSPDTTIPDCYRIVFSDTTFTFDPLSQIARGTPSFGLAVSQTYYAVALLNRQSSIIVIFDC
jgi:hypothetical protein